MAVAFDADSSSYSTAVGVTTVDHTTLTVGSGSNRALILQVVFSNTAITGITAVWDPAGANQSLTQLVNLSGFNVLMQLWGLVAPASGNKTLRVSWTTSSSIIMNAVAFTNVDQTGGATTFPNTNTATGTSTAPSVSITTTSGNATVETSGNRNGDTYSAPSQTSDFARTSGSPGSAGSHALSGGASTTHSWTISASDDWGSVAVDITAVAAAAPKSSLMLLGVG